MIILLLTLTGMFVGLASSFFGIGGGVIAVPAMYMILKNTPAQVVTATSLGMICLNGIIHTCNFYRKGKRAKLKIVAPMIVATICGSIIGAKLCLYIPASTVKFLFGILLIFISIKTLLTKKLPNSHTNEWNIELAPKQLLYLFLFTFIGGMISGLAGVGGGVILVPLLLLVLHMPFSLVPVYSNIIMIFGTLSGTIVFMLKKAPMAEAFEFLQVGHVNWGLAICLSLGALISSRIGIHFSQKVPTQKARPLFAALLLLISINILLSCKISVIFS